jgi:hypothetical protein
MRKVTLIKEVNDLYNENYNTLMNETEDNTKKEMYPIFKD